MGSGVAKLVRELYPNAYTSYLQLCADAHRVCETLNLESSVLLGVVQMVEDKGKIICNMFSQDGYGYNGKLYTNYEAFRECLQELADRLPDRIDIAMPFKIGCGLGGGEWEVVFPMIEDILGEKHNVILYRKEV